MARYVVTFAKKSISEADVASVLQIKKSSVADGLEALATKAEISPGMALHFPAIGVTSLELPEDAFEALCRDERVLEVVEDFEVIALNPCCGRHGHGFHHEGAGGQAGEADPYMAGYHQALIDHGLCSTGLGGARASAFPRPPFRGPACPPGTRRVCECRPIVQPPPPPQLQPILWNIKMIKAEQVWSRTTGSGVKVAVIDTGIDQDHPDLVVSGGASFVPGVDSWDDDQGHGTHCAGIIGARNNAAGVVGVAPDCRLYAVKVLDSQGSGQLSWILAGMGWAAQQGMQVVSMSLGSSAERDAECVLAYQRAAEACMDAGAIVVAAAGNSGREPQVGGRPWVGFPARCPGFLAVGAVDANQVPANFSSNGPPELCLLCGVEIAAPGVSVNSTYLGGGYKELSGTSMACPHVAGAAALLKQLHPTWSPAEIRDRLRDTAQDIGLPGRDPQTGAGLLDCHRAVVG